ncbi:ABC transporter ATP-binding protein [Paenibacillus woosongensis]|uniref:ATP-binding cassette domain-containing protein n=1 Tax=Paenibacillus woosongensis TaxID=307580 RepID=A0A7X3CLH8_9BACL|nr:ABC transporter ATP-binding protein [Paenibacillus woosongensis]MUG44533.1 ATP-binding cassette domain-containing protein [Paenibacillus woosongensis]
MMLNDKELQSTGTDKIRKYKLTVQYIKKMLLIVWSIDPFLLCTTLLLRISQALIPVLQTWLTLQLVNQITLLLEKGSPYILNPLSTLWLQLLVFMASAGIKACDRYVLSKLRIKTQYHFDQLIAEKSSKIPLIHMESSDYYDHFYRISGNSVRVINLIDNVFSILQNTVMLFSMLILMAAVHWGLALGVLLLIIPSLIVNITMGNLRYRQMLEQTPVERKTGYLLDLLSSRLTAKELRSFNLSKYFIDRWSKLFWKNGYEKLYLEKKTSVSVFVVDAFGILVTGTVMILLIWLGAIGKLTMGAYVAMTQTLTTVQRGLEDIAFRMGAIYEDSLFSNPLFTFLELPEEDHAGRVFSFPNKIFKGIQVRNLSFKYPKQNVKALENVSFHINQGEKIAIVGENGSGKTTLIKCLLGLYPATEGEVLIDDIDIRQINLTELRNHITVLYQDFVQYQFSAEENIGVGRVDKMMDKEMIFRAAEKGGALGFIKDLKLGFDTQLGPYFSGGVELSLGQWQKMAISRAFFRDAPIVILDEPTAALDPLAEAAIFDQFMTLSKGKTAIFISHRLGSCRNADRIIVMKEGKIVESGNHNELIQLQGEYHRMFQAQSKWYVQEEKAEFSGEFR